MRRLQSFPAPVASISGLQDQLQQTDWTVEDGELCFLRPTRQLFEFRKGVTSPAANGITTVQAALPGVVGQWTLLADSDQNVVYFSPQGGGADDWPALNTLMAAAAGKQTIVFVAGTYTCNTPGTVPNGTRIVMNSGVTINSTLTPHMDQSQCLFYAAGTYSAASTTLSANAVVGSNTVSVTSISSPAIVDGSAVSLSLPLRAQFYQVVSHSGPGPFVLVLDRPLLEGFTSASTVVKTVTTRPTDIYIDGGGALVTGTVDRVVEFGGALRCTVKNFRAQVTTGDMGFAFDVGSQLCLFENISVAGVSNAGTTYGCSLESCESCVIRNSRCPSGFTYAFMMTDCWACLADNCYGAGATYGIGINSEYGVLGSKFCVVRGGEFPGNVYGVALFGGTNQSVVEGACSTGCSSAGFTDTGTDNRFTDCTSESDNVGLLVQASAVRNKSFGFTSQTAKAYGMQIAAGAKGTVWVDHSVINAATNSIALADELVSSGMRIVNTITPSGSALVYGAVLAPNSLVFDDFDIVTGGGHAFWLYGGAGSVHKLANGHIDLGASGIAIRTLAASATVVISDVHGTGSGSGTTGVYTDAAAFVRREGRVDFSAFATPFQTGVAQYNIGSVTLNGVTPVDYSFGDVKATDPVRLTRKTAGGTAQSALPPTFTITAGSKVSVVSATVNANDTFEIQIG